MGSPAFLSPHSSPSSLSASIPVNTDSTIPASLPLDTTTLASSTSNEPNAPRSPSSPDSPSSLSQNDSKSDFLSELESTKTRYDELQRAFRDCHLALRELSQALQSVPPSTSSLPTPALQTILSRLDEISTRTRASSSRSAHCGRRTRVARGYATLLAVPGAIASAAEAQDVEDAVRAFIEGRDATVARAQSLFVRKRDDLEHDIAALKRAMHELPQAQVPSSPSPPSRPATPATTNTPSSWTSLAAGLFVSGTSSRPASPSPTFGAVVTSTRTRRAVSYDIGPLVTLQHQLRIPMPELHHQATASPSPVRPGSRARTTSGMYMLGLGMRGGVIVPGDRTPQKSTGLGYERAGRPRTLK